MEIETMEGIWWSIDGPEGVKLFEQEYFPTREDAVREYGWPTVYSSACLRGWCARLTMPGFLDCTEWDGVYKTREEAISAVRDMYEED